MDDNICGRKDPAAGGQMTDADWPFEHFTPQEFDSVGAPGSGDLISPKLVGVLERIRTRCGFPLHINSGVRTITHNAAVGGKSGSEHVQGEGADISAPTSGMRYAILKAALLEGVHRVGVGSTFIHIGVSTSLPQDVLWTY